MAKSYLALLLGRRDQAALDVQDDRGLPHLWHRLDRGNIPNAGRDWPNTGALLKSRYEKTDALMQVGVPPTMR